METSVLIMLGAMVAAGLLCVPLVRLLRISNLIRASAQQRHGDLNRTVHDLVGLAEVRERYNIVTMAQSAATMKDPLLVRGVTLALQGQDSQAIRSQLEGSYLKPQSGTELSSWELVRTGCMCLFLATAAMGTVQIVIAGLNGTGFSAFSGGLVAISVFMGMLSGVVSRADWTNASGARRAEVLRKLIVVEGVISLAEGLDAVSMRRRLMGLLPGQGGFASESRETKRAA